VSAGDQPVAPTVSLPVRDQPVAPTVSLLSADN